MEGQAPPPQPHPLDDPVKKPRVVRALAVLTPFIFVLCYVLAWAQGAAPRHGLLIAVVGAGMCAGAAVVIHLMGSRSWMALVALKVALLLVGKR
jgi:hypothetical protein